MRTTLDLDDRVLAAARSLARANSTSVGREISALALKGLARSDTVREGVRVDVSYSPFPVVVAPQEHVVTDDLVAAHRDD